MTPVPYAFYRHADMGWADYLPAHWRDSRLRFVAQVNPTKSELASIDAALDVTFVPMEAVGEDGSLDTSRTRLTSEVATGYTYFRDGDVLVAKITPCFENGKATLAHDLCNGIGFGSTEFHVVRSCRDVDGRFLFYLLWSSAFRDSSTAQMIGAGGQKRVPTEVVSDFRVPIPPGPEQRAIADFLDRETAKIDALIAKQEELIERIEEKRRAIINHAVSLGLDPGAPLRDGRTVWLSTVPEHWQVLALRRVVRKFVDYRGSTPDKIDSGIPLITATAIRDGIIDHLRNPVFISQDEYEERMVRGLPETGDVVLTTEAPLGEVAQIDNPTFAIGQRVILFKVERALMSERFLFYYLISDCGQSELWSVASGSTAQGIKAERLKGISVVVPPLIEQEQIVAMLETETQRFKPLKEAVQHQIDNLRERRSALITAAVTGQIDVANQIALEAAE